MYNSHGANNKNQDALLMTLHQHQSAHTVIRMTLKYDVLITQLETEGQMQTAAEEKSRAMPKS